MKYLDTYVHVGIAVGEKRPYMVCVNPEHPSISPFRWEMGSKSIDSLARFMAIKLSGRNGLKGAEIANVLFRNLDDVEGYETGYGRLDKDQSWELRQALARYSMDR